MKREDILDIFKAQVLKPKGVKWGALATSKGNRPNVRNIVIRSFDGQSLIFYTHGLSEKVEEINKNSSCSLCWYSHRHSLQLRFFCSASILSDKEADQYKKRVTNFRDYKGPAPGDPFEESKVTEDIYFKVVRLKIEKLEALKLDKVQHEKYLFDFKDTATASLRLFP